MRNLIRFLFVGMACSLLFACKGDGGGGGGGAGGSSNASTGSGNTETGTCDSTCAKSIALGCPNGEHDQAACVASCEMQKASCSGQAADFQAFLDCVQSTPMKCGDTTQSPTSEECVAQGLMIFQCASGM